MPAPHSRTRLAPCFPNASAYWARLWACCVFGGMPDSDFQFTYNFVCSLTPLPRAALTLVTPAISPHRYSLSHVIKAVLVGGEDPRERYYAGVYLLKHWQLNQQDRYWRTLRQLVLQAQQMGEERLLSNPYLTVNALLQV